MARPNLPIPRLDPLELYSGLSFGSRQSELPSLPALEASGPRQMLEQLVRPALQDPPCHVCFSGGLDSSALLAVAAHVARREGLPEPIALTARYPGVPEAHEDRWQEHVIDHLKLRDWKVFEVTTEADVLGDVALTALRRFGVTGLAPAHTLLLFARQAARGSMITGTGGDQVFAAGGYRRQAFGRLARSRPRRRVPWELAFNALPLGVRRLVEARWTPLPDLPWLRADAYRRIGAHWRRSVRLTTSYSDDVIAMTDSVGYERTCAVLHAYADWAGVGLIEPFFDPRFMRSLANGSPKGGYTDRTEAFAALFGDLLPPSTLGRTSKATFNGALMGPAAKAFAHEWDGMGLDTEIVDSVKLRDQWTSSFVDVRSLPAMQQAWMASHTPQP